MAELPNDVVALAARAGEALEAFLDEALPRLPALHPDLELAAGELRTFASTGGKRLRPALLLLGHRIAGGDVEDVLGAAVAIELLHTCALLHDDVIDAATTRRGRPTTHVGFEALHRREAWAGDPAAYGAAIAILVGDLAFVLADEAILAVRVEADALLAGLRAFVRLREEVMAGQALDVHAAAIRSTSTEMALAVATLKSGRYSVTRPLQLGAVLGGASDDLVDALGAVGDPLGRAFQLRDDLLGVFGDPGETGKSTSGDLAEGKRTLLIAEAWARMDGQGRAELDAGLGRADLDTSTAQRLRALLRDSGAIEVVTGRVEDEVTAATAALAGLAAAGGDPEGVATLASLTSWFAERRT